MKKSVKDSGINSNEKDIVSRKKRKSGVLKDGIVHEIVLSKTAVDGSWKFKTDDTTKSNSVDIKEKCLVKKTSINYSKRSLFNKSDSNQMPKSPRLVIKKTLDILLEKINFLDDVNNNNIFLNAPMILSLLLQNLVNVSVRKLFALDIGLNKVVEKTSQEKLVIVKKLFSKVNSFREISILLKFVKIICVSFTSELSLAQATEKTRAVNILVNTNLKKFIGHSNQTVVIKKIPVKILAKTVYAVLSEFGIINLIKIQLVELWQKTIVEFKQSNYADLVTAKWSILIKKDTVHVVRLDLDKES
ncbi:hypothetical protein G9A89_014604 [Geosiphon pyriformis]|nr:hypothetical protein G9A89_014604 [Geosiphon pyriformis]